MDQVEEGTIEISAADLPSFLYETGTVYNPDNEVDGLFRGFLLVRVSVSYYYSLFLNIFRSIGTSSLALRRHLIRETVVDRRIRHAFLTLQLSLVGVSPMHVYK